MITAKPLLREILDLSDKSLVPRDCAERGWLRLAIRNTKLEFFLCRINQRDTTEVSGNELE